MSRNNSSSLLLPGQILRVTAEDYETFCGLPGIMNVVVDNRDREEDPTCLYMRRNNRQLPTRPTPETRESVTPERKYSSRSRVSSLTSPGLNQPHIDCNCEVAISPAAGVSGSKTFGGPEYLHCDVDQVSRERPED